MSVFIPAVFLLCYCMLTLCVLHTGWLFAFFLDSIYGLRLRSWLSVSFFQSPITGRQLTLLTPLATFGISKRPQEARYLLEGDALESERKAFERAYQVLSWWFVWPFVSLLKKGLDRGFISFALLAGCWFLANSDRDWNWNYKQKCGSLASDRVDMVLYTLASQLLWLFDCFPILSLGYIIFSSTFTSIGSIYCLGIFS
jgi:hypothetical protein